MRPSPTRARYLLLLAVLVLGGAFSGQMTHTLVLGNQQAAAWTNCFEQAESHLGGQPERAVERGVYVTKCIAPVQRRKAWVTLGGLAVALTLGMGLMWLLPYRYLRRAGPVRAASPEGRPRIEELSREAGVRRIPRVVFGSLQLREAFTVRTVRGTWIVLPPGVAALSQDDADAVMRHEIAHVAAGDTTLVWLTRAVWWALPPVLLAPVLIDVVQGWRSASQSPWTGLVQPLWLEYAVRVALLLAVAEFVSSALLRMREHEADLRSVRATSGDALVAFLARQKSPTLSWWRRARATHPTPCRRVAALADEHLALRTSAGDAVVIGLLAAMTLFAVLSIAISALAGTSGQLYLLVPAALTGPLLAVSWGVAVWRKIMLHSAGETTEGLRGALFGLPVGMLLGAVAQLWNTGVSENGTIIGWASVVTVPVMTAGAGGCTVALARMWADRYADGRRPRWGVAYAANLLIFTGALWIGQGTAVMVSVAGWAGGYALSGIYGPWTTSAAVALAVISLMSWWWASRCVFPTQGSPVHSSALGLLIISGSAAAAALTVRWTISAPAAGGNAYLDTQLDWWTATAAAIACLATLPLLSGGSGLGEAMAAAPLAAFLTVVAIWLSDLPDWHDPLAAARQYVTFSLSLVALALLTAGPAAALSPARGIGTYRWASRTSPILAAFLSGTITAAILHYGDALLVDPT